MWKASTYNTTKVTIELGQLIKDGVKLWDFDYPSYYKGEAKTAFEKKVIDHFYFRQIGQETVGRFLHVFRTRVREIMPRYIDMYKTVEIMNNLDNPFDNVDIVESYEETTSGSTFADGNSSETGSTTTNSTHKYSDTAQGSIENVEHHMSEGSIDYSDVNTGSDVYSQSSTETAGTVSHTLTRKGNQGVNTYAHDMIEFRQSIIDVDMMIIDDLNELFLCVY